MGEFGRMCWVHVMQLCSGRWPESLILSIRGVGRDHPLRLELAHTMPVPLSSETVKCTACGKLLCRAAENCKFFYRGSSTTAKRCALLLCVFSGALQCSTKYFDNVKKMLANVVSGTFDALSA